MSGRSNRKSLSIYRRFGLNDRQIEIVARATPKRDYYCQSARGNRLFELGLGEVALAYTAASSKTDQLAIAEIWPKRTAWPASPPAWLCHRGLAWAADMLRIQIHSPDWANPGVHVMKSSLKKSLGFRSDLAAGAAVLSMTVTALVRAGLSRSRRIVSDPSNYSQNILTAARTLRADQQPDPPAAERRRPRSINEARNLAKPSADHRSNRSSSRCGRRTAAARPARRALPMTCSRSSTTSRVSTRTSIMTGSQRATGPAELRSVGGVASRHSRMHSRFRPVSVGDHRRCAHRRCRVLSPPARSATGALQAAQAGNQLLALQAQQLADLDRDRRQPRPRPVARCWPMPLRPRRRPASNSAVSLLRDTGSVPATAQMFP